MELTRNQKILIGIAIVVILALLATFLSKKKKTAPSSSSDDVVVIEQPEKTATVKSSVIYGSMSCPYTVKQIEKYPEYTFIECTGGECPEFVSSFPTTVHPDGNIEVGFN